MSFVKLRQRPLTHRPFVLWSMPRAPSAESLIACVPHAEKTKNEYLSRNDEGYDRRENDGALFLYRKRRKIHQSQG